MVRALTDFAADIAVTETQSFFVPVKVPRLTVAGRPFLKTFASEKEAETAFQAWSKGVSGGKSKRKAKEVDPEETDVGTGDLSEDEPLAAASRPPPAKPAPVPVTAVPPALAAGEVKAPVTGVLPGASSSSSSGSAAALQSQLQQKALGPYCHEDRLVMNVRFFRCH